MVPTDVVVSWSRTVVSRPFATRVLSIYIVIAKRAIGEFHTLLRHHLASRSRVLTTPTTTVIHRAGRGGRARCSRMVSILQVPWVGFVNKRLVAVGGIGFVHGVRYLGLEDVGLGRIGPSVEGACLSPLFLFLRTDCLFTVARSDTPRLSASVHDLRDNDGFGLDGHNSCRLRRWPA